MSNIDKSRIISEFRRGEQSNIRIIVVTKSLGTGVDLDYIYIVVQYSMPLNKTLSII